MTTESGIVLIPIDKLKVSPFNVRRRIGDLTDLKNSIKSLGLLQPIIVRPVEDGFEVVVGQRRFLACKELGWENIPAIIKKLSDREALELSLTENIQTESLDPIERAEGVEALIKIYEREMPRMMAIKQIANIIGKSTRTIYEWLRILQTTEAVKELVRERKLPIKVAAHIATLPMEVQEEAAKTIVEEELPEPIAVRAIQYVKRRGRQPVKQVITSYIQEMEEYSVTVTFPGKIYMALVEYAERNKLTIPEVVRRAVSRFLGISS